MTGARVGARHRSTRSHVIRQGMTEHLRQMHDGVGVDVRVTWPACTEHPGIRATATLPDDPKAAN